ncbi:MAG: S8 family serine peptidase [Nitrospirae bacterium]|nr:S8 family serine peptidase [Nitrospirota bacterium]
MKARFKYPVQIAIALLLVISAISYSHAENGGVKRSDRIALRNFPFKASAGEPSVPQELMGKKPAPGRPGYLVVKFLGKDNQAARKRLTALGVRFFGYIPDDAFLAKVPQSAMAALSADPAVEFTGEYRPAYRLHKKLIDAVSRKDKGSVTLVMQAFDGEDLGPIRDAVASLGGTSEVMSDRPGLNGKFLKVVADASKLASLADVEGVQWIEEEEKPVLFNDKSATVLNADYLWSLSVPLKGTGQIVGVADTGLDTGDRDTLHPDFAGTTSDGKTKLKSVYWYGRLNPAKWDDPDGHGTHVAGSVLGSGAKADELTPSTPIKGMAYDGQLVFQSLLTAAGGLLAANVNTIIFPDAYGQGARIHSNSWGFANSYGDYTYSASLADTFTWEHKDFTPVFSAGNDGVDLLPDNGTSYGDGVVELGSLSSPATAKNVIAVGASENNRPTLNSTYGQNWAADFTQNPIQNDRVADNTSGMVGFSSRGPCDDGRIKPDIVAPGTFVMSTKSSMSSAYWTTASQIGYNASLNNYYASNGGTSMSAPLAAGAAALVREYLVEVGITSPPSALVKAVLVAGAHDMTPGQYTSPSEDVSGRPDNNQGWGRLDLKAALFPVSPTVMLHKRDDTGLSTSGYSSYTFTVGNATVPVRVNLVWTDYPSTTAASIHLVNDIDLTVTAPDGHVYHGNRYSGSASIPDDPNYDRLNNVEGVTVPASSMSAGTLTVRVDGYNVPNGPQPFAVVLSGGFSNTPPTVTGIDPATAVNSLPTSVSVTGTGFQQGAALLVGGVSCTVTDVTSTTITGSIPAGISAGAKEVRVVNPDYLYGSLVDGFTVTADTVAPSAPARLLASPGNQSINLKWTPAPEPDVTGYRVVFNNISAMFPAGSSHRLYSLTDGQEYSVHLKAVDGSGNVSGPSNTVTATPFTKTNNLQHMNWNASPDFQCLNCHIDAAGAFLPAGYDYRMEMSFCMSCHNAAAVAHDTAVYSGASHKVMVNVTSGGARMPTYGNVTSGEYSDAMYSHLKDGDKVVCSTCHNAMQKPNDQGRTWEYTTSPDGRTFKAYRGGWWDQGHARVNVYHDTSLGMPSYPKDREKKRVAAGKYTFDEYSGLVTFTNVTSDYVLVTLDDPYLRAPGQDNVICSDCHGTEATHQEMNCMTCHAAHGTTNLKGIKSSVRRPGGTYKPVVFKRYTEANSFADGGATYDGICEVCHESTLYYRSDGSGFVNHSGGANHDRKDCTACHGHGGGFAK